MLNTGRDGEGEGMELDLNLVPGWRHASPIVQPNSLTIRVPCQGRPEDALSINMTNPSKYGMIYKITGPKLRLFCEPIADGYVAPETEAVLRLTPKPIQTGNGFKKNNHIYITCGYLTMDDVYQRTDPNSFWNNNTRGRYDLESPVATKLFKIDIRTEDANALALI